MSFKAKRFFKKLISWLGLFFFAIAAYMIYLQLKRYTLDDIREAIIKIPNKNILYACIASFFGYVVLAGYDYLALRYIKRQLTPWKWIFAGFIGFSVSNNAGHAIVSGGAIRYRLYTRWRFQANEIVRMVTFSGFTYLVACFFLVILGYFITPGHAFGDGSVSHLTTMITAAVSAVGLLLYLSASLFYKKPLQISGIEFQIPSFRMSLAQVALGTFDSIMASLVLYFALTPFINIEFNTFIGVFIIAQVLGVFSQVPGGLGVFETLFLLILPGDHEMVAILGALIVFRVVYYLMPLVISGIALFTYEGRLKNLRNKILKRYHEELHKKEEKDKGKKIKL